MTTAYHAGDFRRVFVDQQREIAALAHALEPADAIGVDLEMTQRQDRKPGGVLTWVHSLSLIQIASDDISAVIDPLRCRDLSSLGPLLAGPARKVFLGGGQDATLLDKEGIPPRNVVDVGEIALGIFGRREDGMAALARRIFGISLDKTVRRADWSRRPLNPALINYAHQDAELTLMIYRWFQNNYPEDVSIHERLEIDPQLPPESPAWLLEAMRSSSTDILVLLASHQIDPQRSHGRLVEALRQALRQSTAPRQRNRLLRIAGDLGLKELLPEAVSSAESKSSLIRAAAARAVGRLAEVNEGEPVLLQLKTDQLEEVRKAAEAALKELHSPPAPSAEDSEESGSALDDGALSALARLRERLESANG